MDNVNAPHGVHGMPDEDAWVSPVGRTHREAVTRRMAQPAYRLAALAAEVARLRAALVEERAGTLWADWSGVHPGTEYFEALARRQLIAEGLLPPA